MKVEIATICGVIDIADADPSAIQDAINDWAEDEVLLLTFHDVATGIQVRVPASKVVAITTWPEAGATT